MKKWLEKVDWIYVIVPLASDERRVFRAEP